MGCLNSRKPNIEIETVEGIEDQLFHEQKRLELFIEQNKNTDCYIEAEELKIKLTISLQINLLEDQILQREEERKIDF